MIVENEEQLESYKPIPNGGAKLLIVVMFATLCCVIEILGIFWSHNINEMRNQLLWGIGLAASLFVSFLLVCWSTRIIMDQKPMDWLGEYFKRNVRGHRIWYRFDDEGQVVREIDQIALVRDKLPLGKVHLELFLGGWFKRPRVIESGICWDATVRVRQHKNTGVVTLIDESGDRVRLFIEDALKIIRHSYSPRFLDWPEIVGKLLTDLSDTKQLNREQSGEYNGLKIKRDALLIVLEDIIKRMQDTTRFGKSREGQRLREYVEDGLLHFLPEDDSRRYGLEMTVAKRQEQREKAAAQRQEQEQEESGEVEEDPGTPEESGEVEGDPDTQEPSGEVEEEQDPQDASDA